MASSCIFRHRHYRVWFTIQGPTRESYWIPRIPRAVLVSIVALISFLHVFESESSNNDQTWRVAFPVFVSQCGLMKFFPTEATPWIYYLILHSSKPIASPGAMSIYILLIFPSQTLRISQNHRCPCAVVFVIHPTCRGSCLLKRFYHPRIPNSSYA